MHTTCPYFQWLCYNINNFSHFKKISGQHHITSVSLLAHFSFLSLKFERKIIYTFQQMFWSFKHLRSTRSLSKKICNKWWKLRELGKWVLIAGPFCPTSLFFAFPSLSPPLPPFRHLWTKSSGLSSAHYNHHPLYKQRPPGIQGCNSCLTLLLPEQKDSTPNRTHSGSPISDGLCLSAVNNYWREEERWEVTLFGGKNWSSFYIFIHFTSLGTENNKGSLSHLQCDFCREKYRVNS